MPTKVTFETAALQDALKKADRIAPGKGKAFDQSGGIVMELLPAFGQVVLRATDGEIFYREWVTAEIETDRPDAIAWRLPNMMLTPVVTSLPIGTGKTVVFNEPNDGGKIELKSGRVKAKINQMDISFYPEWEVFNPDDLSPVADMGGRLGMTEWCASTDTPPLTGVHFTGDEIRVTDRYRLVCVPLKIENMPAPVTVPAGLLASVLKQTGEVMVGFTEHQMLLMPNETTQIRAVLIGGDYPKLDRIMDRDRPNKVTFKKEEMISSIQRAVIAAGGDRLPTLSLYMGREEITVLVRGEETSIMDAVEVPGYCTHDRIEILLTPKNLQDVLQHSPNDSITLHYDAEEPGKILFLDGGSGFESWVVPRKPGN